MRQSHKNGEDKPPLKLSINNTDFNHGVANEHPFSSIDKNGANPNALLSEKHLEDDAKPADGGQTLTQDQDHPREVSSSTAASRDVIVDRCETLDQASSGVAEHDSAYGQTSYHAPEITKSEATSNGNDDEQTTIDTAVVQDDHTYPEGGLAAWLVVLGSFSGMVASFGVLNSVGTFQAYLSTHQLAEHSPSSIGWVFSIYAFLTFFCGVQIGPFFDAKGARWLVAAGSIFLFVGLMGVAESTKLWHFILTFSIISGIGSSLVFTPAVGAIAHWFMRRRATATGLATTGGSIGGIVFPLMLQRLFPLVGFRWTTRILAFTFLFLLTIANLLIRTRLTPCDRRKAGEKDIPKTNILRDICPDFRIFKHTVFFLTTAGVFFIELALFIPISYISIYALLHNVSPTFSYQLLSILNVGSFFGRWAPGYMADRFGRFNTMIATVALCMLSVFCLWLTCTPESGAGGVAQVIIFALIFGFGSGSNISLTPVCVGQLCGTEVFGRWYASLYTVVSFGCLIGIPIAGQLLESDGGRYTALIAFVGGCYGLGLACFVWARVLKVGWGVRRMY
ncbi:hypothetical protein ACLMJK_008457 [Lecanora helva]